jgi:hypothetical protein
MTTAPFIRRASVALAALTLACGDSTGPSAKLSQDQVGDLLEALTAVSSFGPPPGTALAVVNISQTVDCPNGGSASVNATVNDNQTAGTATIQITQGFSGCKATSKKGRVWTFDGNPDITTNISASHNATTGAFSITGSQVGGIKFASDLGTGSCEINLTFSLTGDAHSFSGSLTGSACGHNIQQSISVTE